MGRVRFHARLLALYFAQYAKARLAYRADFAAAVLASFLGTAASFSVVLLLFSRFPHLAGWTFPEVVFLYGFSLLPYGLFNVLSLNLYEFADRYLVEGRFDRILLRPVSPLFQVLFESFRLEALQEVVTGTVAVAHKAAALTKAGSLVSIAGGGDTVAALNHAGVADDFTYISTAGGAFLEWMEGKALPGVEALRT